MFEPNGFWPVISPPASREMGMGSAVAEAERAGAARRQADAGAAGEPPQVVAIKFAPYSLWVTSNLIFSDS